MIKFQENIQLACVWMEFLSLGLCSANGPGATVAE